MLRGLVSKPSDWILMLVTATYILNFGVSASGSGPAELCIMDMPSQCTHVNSNGDRLPCYITENEGGCLDDLYPPVNWYEIPAKPRDVRIVNRKSIGDSTLDYPEFNITWILDLKQNPDKVQGIQIAITGLTNHHKFEHSLFNKVKCVTFDLSTADLTTSDVPSLPFYFDCFGQLSPESRYAVMLRTLPLPESDRHDVTRSSTMVWKIVSTPTCSDPIAKNFYECNRRPQAGYEPAYWAPVTMETHTYGYNEITVRFDLPPEEYNLDVITVYIFHHDSKTCQTRKPVFYQDLEVAIADIYTYAHAPTTNQTSENITMLTFTAHNVSGGYYCAGIRPNPSRRLVCKSGPRRSFVICTMTISAPFAILDDPCETKPCGVHGICNSNGPEYMCECSPGFALKDGFCQENSCYGNPCGHNGTCQTVIGKSHFTCECNDGYNSYQGHCTVDPCKAASLIKCGQYGVCFPTREMDNFTCQCLEGYVEIDRLCQAPGQSLTYITIATVGGTCTGLFLLVPLMVWAIRMRKNSGRGRQINLQPLSAKNMRQYNQVSMPLTSTEADCVNPELLLLYSKDCSQHIHVVECFARFLEIRFGCKVHLDLWQTTEIAPAKTEWLFQKMKLADKIIIIASKGTKERWIERCDADVCQKSPAARDSDDFLTSALNIVSSDFNLRERSDRFGKYTSVYFDYSDASDIPEPIRIMGTTFELLRSIEQFYFHLRNINSRSLAGHYKVADLRERILASEEGKALEESIASMKRYVSDNPDWQADCHSIEPPESHVNDLWSHLPGNVVGDGDSTHDQTERENVQMEETARKNCVAEKSAVSVSYDDGYHSVQSCVSQKSRNLGERELGDRKQQQQQQQQQDDSTTEHLHTLLPVLRETDKQSETTTHEDCVDYCKISWDVTPAGNTAQFYYIESENNASQNSLASSELGTLAFQLNSTCA